VWKNIQFVMLPSGERSLGSREITWQDRGRMLRADWRRDYDVLSRSSVAVLVVAVDIATFGSSREKETIFATEEGVWVRNSRRALEHPVGVGVE
jgi:hypothetical protein